MKTFAFRGVSTDFGSPHTEKVLRSVSGRCSACGATVSGLTLKEFEDAWAVHKAEH